MHEIRARNVNDAVPKGYQLLMEGGVRNPSRYGDVVELEEPVTTHYANPLERVLFDPHRDANPFFHFFEALWILAGRRDVAFLARFNARIASFSDDGQAFHAAYGHRLRKWPSGVLFQNPLEMDQLSWAIEMLKRDPGSRQIVCSIWNPPADLGVTSRDLPCNDMIKFEARHGKLNMVVFNRSNDLVWGTYGANAVQFAFIQEYVAGMAGLPVGWYEQVSANYHGYEATLDKASQALAWPNPYRHGAPAPHPLVADPGAWDAELRSFLQWMEGDTEEGWPDEPSTNPFFQRVAAPLALAHRAYKAKNISNALEWLKMMPGNNDWRLAATEWLGRRQ